LPFELGNLPTELRDVATRLFGFTTFEDLGGLKGDVEVQVFGLPINPNVSASPSLSSSPMVGSSPFGGKPTTFITWTSQLDLPLSLSYTDNTAIEQNQNYQFLSGILVGTGSSVFITAVYDWLREQRGTHVPNERFR